MSRVAVIFDYDDTLVPDTTSQLLEHHGLNTEEFWKVEFKNLAERGYCPTHAYLKLLLDKAKEGSLKVIREAQVGPKASRGI